MRIKRLQHSPRAFTLVEVLLGLAIAAIIGVSVYNLFWSSMKLDERLRHSHDHWMEILLADQAMTRDLDNAVSLDLSGSYPDAAVFEGQAQEFSFMTQTPSGLKHVRYYAGLPPPGGLAYAMIGRVVNHGGSANSGSSPDEFLLRQESSLADWLNETNHDASTQIIAAGLKKGSFNCRFAPFTKNLHTGGAQELNFAESWDEKGLPLAVSCAFVLSDPSSRAGGPVFKRDFYLPPVEGLYNEQ